MSTAPGAHTNHMDNSDGGNSGDEMMTMVMIMISSILEFGYNFLTQGNIWLPIVYSSS